MPTHLNDSPREMRHQTVLFDEFPAIKPAEEWHACLKQLTRCVIVYQLPGQGGEWLEVEATNSCRVGDAEECPRVTAGSPSGEGYELCGPPKHAEAEAAALLPQGAHSSTAYLYGHTWMCGPCQHSLTDAGVRQFVITGEPA